MDPVAESVRDITPAWLSGALQDAGHNLTVTAVAPEEIGTGQMGATYRVQLAYDGPAGPTTLVVKLASSDESTRQLVSAGYAAEVGFYLHVAPLLRINTPRCWYGAITEEATEFTLLLDDVTPATPGVQAEGCTVSQAAASLKNLLELHVPLWNDPRLNEWTFLMHPSPAMASVMGEVMKAATNGFVGRYADQLEAVDVETLHRASEGIAEWQMARLNPCSAIHGDYRLDNLLFTPGRNEVVVVDWQTAAVGPPLRDVAYFLGTCLGVDDRRAHEERLVADYHRVLRVIPDYDATRCWDDYRLGQLQGPMITVIGCMYAPGTRSQSTDAMFLAMARRSCAAIRDLRSLDLL